MALCSLAPQVARAVPTRNGDFLKNTMQVDEVTSPKEFYVGYDSGTEPFKELQVFVVVRQIEDPLRPGWFDFEVVGRAAVAETYINKAHFVLYKPFKGAELRKKDHIVPTGDPLTLDEMDLLRKEVIGVLDRDKELEDLYTGLISFKLGLYTGSLASTSKIGGVQSDTNAFKKANQISLRNFGLRWWFFFNPQLGLNVEYASGNIPTVSDKGVSLNSTQTYLNPGLIYRSRFIFIPAIYSVTYFINKFATENKDDYLISSSYSGVNLGVTLYYPYRLQIFKLWRFTFSFNNAEIGGGYAPAVNVSDEKFVRGASVSGNQISFNGGLEFNLAIRGLRFTQDIFFVLEGGQQRYSLAFSGATQGFLPDGTTLIPENVVATETQSWYGIRIKYNMRDMVGELLSGL